MTATALELIVIPVFWGFLYSLIIGFLLSRLIAGLTAAALRFQAQPDGAPVARTAWSAGECGGGAEHSGRAVQACMTPRAMAGEAFGCSSTLHAARRMHGRE